jgi:dienelactone hydrolase
MTHMSVVHSKITFNSDGIELFGYLYPAQNKVASTGVLFIHGASKGVTHNIFDHWQTFLSQHNISSMSYFTRGVAESGGIYEDSSLLNREIDAKYALEYFQNTGIVDPAKIAILANSMGGHVAAKLAGDPAVGAIILYAAAAYSKEAEDKKIDHTFTEVITKENSWSNSPAFRSLENSQKPTLVMYPQNDQRIPHGVQDRYKSLVNPSDFIVIPDSDHETISEKNNGDDQVMLTAFKHSLKFLRRVIG